MWEIQEVKGIRTRRGIKSRESVGKAGGRGYIEVYYTSRSGRIRLGRD